MNQSNIFITGAGGQLGTALRQYYPKARSADVDELDITNQQSIKTFDWSQTKIIINTAAYTDVDGAETPIGRAMSWKVNAQAVGNLTSIARRHNIMLIHISTDYVFDGTKTPHTEDEPFSPLNVYGASKSAGDLLVAQLDKHYILRTSWVVGEGKNFVRTMLELAKKGINPSVINDQIGRLTFTDELVRAIDHLISQKAPFGTYNVTNSGEASSWAEIARKIYELSNLPNIVTRVSTADYHRGKPNIAPRPRYSELSLDKIQATSFTPKSWQDSLKEYLSGQKN